MTKTVRGPKKPPRGKGKKRRSPTEAHARLKELWQTPEFRERMRVRTANTEADRKANPAKYKRAGVPNGMTKATVEPLWARARQLADRFIKIMKDNGELPELPDDIFDVVVPETDAGKAEAALHEAFVLAVGPSDQKIKIQAINTVLNFTKSKPESRSKLTLNKAEDFLDALGDD
jgi:hypothetical protein